MILGGIEVHATGTDYRITVDDLTISVRPRDAALLGVSLIEWATNQHSVKGVGADALRAIAAELEREADRREGKMVKDCMPRCDDDGSVRLRDDRAPGRSGRVWVPPAASS